MSRIKGSTLVYRFHFLAERFGEAAPARLKAALPAADTALLESGILASEWYPFDLYNRVDAAICRLFADDDPLFCRKIGADSAHRAVAGVYRAWAKDGPERLLRRLPALHAALYDAGGIDVTEAGPGRWLLRARFLPRSTRTNCLVAMGFYGALLERAGARDVCVAEAACSGDGAVSCLFQVAWAASS